MDNFLFDGVPLESDYRTIIKSDSFQELEKFSNDFLSTNKASLRDYMNKWVEDPLHQWSRQWEYPFVFNRVKKIIQQAPGASVLDAGSGVTFFPYYVKAQFASVKVCCCDYDAKLTGIYGQINSGAGEGVEFSVADLRDLPYEDECFDMIYCVSVVEHTDDYEKIIDEFYRILRPGGELVVTFDVSLDGVRDISVDKGTKLLTVLSKRFAKDSDLSLDLNALVSKPGVFTTLTAQGINAALLPWKYPAFVYQIKSFIATGRFCSWPPPLTVFCIHLTKSPI